VLNYNGRRLLEVVLASLAAQQYRDFEVLVVDDCSSDDSLDYLRREWPAVRVVVNQRNLGVTASLNVAVGASAGELVALLNNDIELDPHWLGALVAALDRHPEAASAAGKLLSYHRRDVLDGAGDVFTSAAMAWGRGAGQHDRGQYDREQEIFAPTGGAGLYRAAALADVGPFDESFWAYLEDVDWGLRAQLAGYRCRYVPDAVGYHMGGATTNGQRDPRFYIAQHRNALAIIVKDVPAPFILRHFHQIAWQKLLGLLYGARAGMLRAHLKALAEAARACPRWLRQRRAIMARRRIAAGDFERFVSAGRG
jgi:GT2 family glycosyltransferase